MTKIAVIGAGLIGRAWAIVFARAGYETALWDPAPGAAEAALGFAAARLPELHAADLLRGEAPAAVLARLDVAASLGAALDGADYVQENGPERVEAKRDLFSELDRGAAPHSVLASSTSAIPASAFTGNLAGRGRCLVAHPVNPPYLLPVVELCPAPATHPDTLERARTIMRDAGMVPVTVNRELQGFVLNRLQAALLAEAFRLVEDGIASPGDVDATVKHGLGPRWALMGPFETIDLNAPGGMVDYCGRYGPPMTEMVRSMQPREWSEALVREVDETRRKILPMTEHAARQAWRDRRLMALLAHRAGQPD